MSEETREMPERKTIALIAHDHRKPDLVAWARDHKEMLARHDLCATGNTGELIKDEVGLEVTRYRSGPLGGDQQIGAKIADGDIDFLIFFWDPLEPLAHDPDIKALLRMAVIWNIPLACNRSTADFVLTSPYMSDEYTRRIPDHSGYRH